MNFEQSLEPGISALEDERQRWVDRADELASIIEKLRALQAPELKLQGPGRNRRPKVTPELPGFKRRAGGRRKGTSKRGTPTTRRPGKEPGKADGRAKSNGVRAAVRQFIEGCGSAPFSITDVLANVSGFTRSLVGTTLYQLAAAGELQRGGSGMYARAQPSNGQPGESAGATSPAPAPAGSSWRKSGLFQRNDQFGPAVMAAASAAAEPFTMEDLMGPVASVVPVYKGEQLSLRIVSVLGHLREAGLLERDMKHRPPVPTPYRRTKTFDAARRKVLEDEAAVD